MWLKEDFKKAYIEKFIEIQGARPETGTPWEKYRALVALIKEKISISQAGAKNASEHHNGKQVYYFSLEFLIGKLLSYYLINLGIKDVVREGLEELGIDLEELIGEESDAALGNGGLGRLSACYLDSMAFLGIPGHGNGIRYKYGLFQQKIVNGFQVELPDNWLKNGYPWEMRKSDNTVVVKFKGYVRTENIKGRLTFFHEGYEQVLAVPYDVPMMGFGALNQVNNLRLWSAEPAKDDLDLVSFNQGDYSKAVAYRSEVEAISYILYPEDSSHAGQELRLRQEYFFTAAGLSTIVRYFKKRNKSFADFPRKVAVHINDTHPALCVPELMRILIDEEGLGWEESWNITVNTISFTNHTILPEAMEKWPVDIMKYQCPRIYMIIEEIDRRYREEMMRRYPGKRDLIEHTAIIRNGQIHMAHLAVIGSNSVNGVAALHTMILKSQVLKEFYTIYPYKFNNKTNGVSHRRFLLEANPDLSKLISETIGEEWILNSTSLEKLLPFQGDAVFLEKLSRVKYQNKCRLANFIKERMNIPVDPTSIFDIQVKRIHAYKRQLLNIFKIMDLYNRWKEDPNLDIYPTTFIFGGKVAPGYQYAKSIVKLITTVAHRINTDPTMEDKMKVIFLENFNVSLAEMIYPAADISEQISTASQEASGTGNMKFMLNGAITLGTLDGANVEIRQAVGNENIAIFGLRANEVLNYYQWGGYQSWAEYQNFSRLKKVVDQLVDGSLVEGHEFAGIYESLLRDNDQYFVLKDFRSYTDTWQKLNTWYQHKLSWARSCLVNIGKGGIFSSDRAVKEYADEIWQVPYQNQ